MLNDLNHFKYKQNMLSNSEFFNHLSDDYDEMINFEKAINNKTTSLANFISKNDIHALDLGCGTGVDAIVLTKLGMVVVAVDHSKGMLEQAVKNSNKFDANISFIHSSLTDFAIRDKSFDIIVSLGNTIANLKSIDLKNLIQKLYNYLNKDGKIVIQMINYSKLPANGIYILNTFENESVSIIRKYNIRPKSIDFIIDKIDKENNKETQIMTKLYPHSEADFLQLANEIGFSIELYGNLNKASFVAKESPNLVVVLTK